MEATHSKFYWNQFGFKQKTLLTVQSRIIYQNIIEAAPLQWIVKIFFLKDKLTLFKYIKTSITIHYNRLEKYYTFKSLRLVYCLKDNYFKYYKIPCHLSCFKVPMSHGSINLVSKILNKGFPKYSLINFKILKH